MWLVRSLLENDYNIDWYGDSLGLKGCDPSTAWLWMVKERIDGQYA